MVELVASLCSRTCGDHVASYAVVVADEVAVELFVWETEFELVLELSAVTELELELETEPELVAALLD